VRGQRSSGIDLFPAVLTRTLAVAWIGYCVVTRSASSSFLDPAAAPEAATETVQLNELPVSSHHVLGTALSATHLHDDLPSVASFMQRPRLLSTVLWTTATAHDVSILELNMGSEMYTKLASFGATARYRGYRGTLCVRVDMNGSVYHAGRILASWAQSGACGVTALQPLTPIAITNLSQRSTLPCVWLDPTSAESYTLKLPIRVMGGFQRGSFSDNLTFRVVNPLRWYGTVGSPSDVQLKVYGWVEDLELLVPTFQSELDGQSGHVIPSVTRKIRGYASTFARSTADAVLTSVGLGSPSVITESTSTFEQKAPLFKSDRPSRSEKLTGHQGFEESITPLEGGDPMDFKDIYPREAWLNRVVWSDGTSGSLVRIPVNPCVTAGSSYTSGTATGGFQLTPMGFIAYPFEYWRGTLAFRIEVVGPKLIRGRLKLVYVPPGSTWTPGTETADLHCAYVDVSSAVEHELLCPYSAETPWLLVREIASNGTVSSTYENGYFYLEIVDPLRANGIPVEVNIFVRATDLEVAVPAPHLNNLYLGGTTTALPQAPLAMDRYANIRDAIKLPRLFRYYDFSFNSQISTIIRVVGVPNFRIAATPATATYATVNECNLTNCVATTFTNMLAWYSSAFLMSRGSMRMSLQPIHATTNDIACIATLQPYDTTVGTTISGGETDIIAMANKMAYACAMRDADQISSMTVDIPTALPVEFRAGRSNPLGALARPLVEFMVNGIRSDNTEEGPSYLLFTSAGDDYSLDVFQFVPTLYTAVV
jgi:hypothetical protein